MKPFILFSVHECFSLNFFFNIVFNFKNKLFVHFTVNFGYSIIICLKKIQQ